MMLISLFKNRYLPFVIAALFSLIASLANLPSFNNIEAAINDQFWRLIASSSQRERRVVVINIDDDSIAKYGAWPWPRERTAQLLKNLSEQGVAERIIDMAFPDAKAGDEQLAKELLKTPTVMAQVLALNADEVVARGQLQGGLGSELCTGLFPTANGYIANAADLRAANTGHISPRIAEDGAIRFVPAIICYEHQAYPTLALAALAEGAGANSAFTLKIGSSWLEPFAALTHPSLAGFSIPLNGQGDILLPWWTSRSAIISISAKELMEGTLPTGYLQGAWAIIGGTAFGMTDSVTTPQASAVSGVEVHAQLLTGLLDKRIPYQPRGSGLLQCLWIIVLAGLLTAVTRLRSAYIHAYAPPIIGLLLIASTLGLSALLLWRYSLCISWLPAVVFIIIAQILLGAQDFLNTKAEGDRLYRHLASYLPAHVAKKIAQQEPVSTLNARHEQVVVLYADLRNFSAWCNHLPADQAGAVLHSFYSFTDSIIHQYGGEVEEYVGDAVMGVWRDELADLKPLLAARQIITMSEQLYGAETGVDQLPPLAVGIGIEQGEVLVGSFGPARRRVHTLLGKTVTTAIRLQEMTGDLSQPIICGEAMAKAWQEQTELHSLGRFLLPGLQKASEL
ncbi:MAG: adenylate/guanylate cyclase domain-containing protein, partial [Methylococcaceae bacterium]